MIQSLMIQYNIIQDQTEQIFLYCITLAILLLLQLTRAGTNAFKFHWFYKPFEKFAPRPAARAILLQNDKYLIGFIRNYEKSQSNCSLTGPELTCYFRLRNFICCDATYQITIARVMVLQRCSRHGNLLCSEKTYQMHSTRATFLIQSTSQSVVQQITY